MQLENLVGQWAVRTKPSTRKELCSDGYIGGSGRYIDLPDYRFCADPVFIRAVENGVVYIERPKFMGGTSKEILEPKYCDDNWSAVNPDYMDLPDLDQLRVEETERKAKKEIGFEDKVRM